MENVVVLGASDKPERYSYKAAMLLKDYGHNVIPVHPKLSSIEGIDVVNALADVKGDIDTLTLYVGSERVAAMAEEIVKLKPKRVIFNPGTENNKLKETLEENGIFTLEACTLVLLRTEQF